MAGDSVEKGDKVSWNWGGGAPGGEVAEKKTEGEIAITSKRGNKIKKNASPENPAIHVERSGNDVVKRESEVKIDEKASGHGSKEDKKKRKADEQTQPHEDEDKHIPDDQGNEVRAGGKTSSKAGKPGTKKHKTGEGKSAGQTEEAKTNGTDTKSRGRPKGEQKKSDKKEKPRQDRVKGDMVSTRTRSQGKTK